MTPTAFRALRKSLGLTQAALADALGIGESTVRGYESARGTIPPTVAMALQWLAQQIAPKT